MIQHFKRTLASMAVAAVILPAFAQKTVTGTVRDTEGEPMIGVTVVVDGTSTGSITDIDGNFSIANVPDGATLKVSYVGFKDQKITIGGKTKFEIQMSEDTKSLDELVVVGYGVVKKSDLTGSVGSIHSDDIVSKGATNLAGGLQGAVAVSMSPVVESRRRQLHDADTR